MAKSIEGNVFVRGQSYYTATLARPSNDIAKAVVESWVFVRSFNHADDSVGEPVFVRASASAAEVAALAKSVPSGYECPHWASENEDGAVAYLIEQMRREASWRLLAADEIEAGQVSVV